MEILPKRLTIKVAFTNLIENACKFSEDKAAGISIDYISETLTKTVSDRGEGISEEDVQQIFKPFYRGSNKALTEGSGLGLSSSKRIIEMHGAQIQITSKKASGTLIQVLWKEV